MTDVRIFQTDDGGEVEFVNGQIVTNDGLESAAYLSLFGGNEEDDGTDGSAPLQWWGNLLERNPARQYRSQTQALLRSMPAIPVNLRRLEDAAQSDLAWMVDVKLAKSVTASARLAARDTAELEIMIVIDDREYRYVFTQAWRARLQ